MLAKTLAVRFARVEFKMVSTASFKSAGERHPQKMPKMSDQSHYFPFKSVTYEKTKPLAKPSQKPLSAAVRNYGCVFPLTRRSAPPSPAGRGLRFEGGRLPALSQGERAGISLLNLLPSPSEKGARVARVAGRVRGPRFRHSRSYIPTDLFNELMRRNMLKKRFSLLF